MDKQRLQNVLQTYINAQEDKAYQHWIVRDHVTGIIAAWFDESGKIQINDKFIIRKNYVFYMENYYDKINSAPAA